MPVVARKATFFFNDTATTEIYTLSLHDALPIRTSSWTLPAIKDGNATFYTAMRASLDVATAKPKMPKFFEVYDALTAIAQEVGLGRIKPEEAAKRGQAEMLKLCTKCLL